MKLKTSVAAMCAVGLMSVLPVAHADLFTFDPDGAGSGVAITGAASIDQAQGNSLAIGGAVPPAPGSGLVQGQLPVGTVLNNLYQANLNSIQGVSGNNLYSNGSNGIFYTFVAGFTERVTFTSAAPDGSIVNNTFSINPGGFFKMCQQSALGNNLAGTGFGCAGNGILNATAVGGTASQTGFQTTLLPLDSFGNNDRSPTLTTSSNGSADLTLRITFADPNFFPDLTEGSILTLSFVNTSNITPFRQADPSFLFSLTGVTADTADNIGAINGLSGPNFQFQADANQSFVRAVP